MGKRKLTPAEERVYRELAAGCRKLKRLRQGRARRQRQRQADRARVSTGGKTDA